MNSRYAASTRNSAVLPASELKARRRRPPESMRVPSRQQFPPTGPDRGRSLPPRSIACYHDALPSPHPHAHPSRPSQGETGLASGLERGLGLGGVLGAAVTGDLAVAERE